MARPDIEYMIENGYESPEQAIIAMVDIVAKAKAVLAERDAMIAAHEESISELKAQKEQADARIIELEKWLAPTTVPPPTEPEPYVTLPEPERTEE